MKRPPHWLLALGRSSPPERITVAGNEYRLRKLFKHDFFAATAMYAGTAGDVVLKIGRRADVFGVPTAWIGRLLAQHEASMLRALQDLEGVPRFIGRWQATGVVHEFIPGSPLSREARVPDDFFDRLGRTVQAIHDREMAYVDLEKPQNVIVGDDGKPYLVDFQIGWHLSPKHGGRTPPGRWLLRRLQEGDRYHLLKLRRRVRRDQLSAEELEQSYRKPFYVRLHRRFTGPLLRLRRGTLNRLDPDGRGGERGTINV